MNTCHEPAGRSTGGQFCSQVASRAARRAVLEDPTVLSDPTGVVAKLRAVAADGRSGVSIVQDHERTRFLLPDGTRIGGAMEHRGILARALGARVNLEGLQTALLSGLVRVNSGRHGGVEARKGLSHAQATIIADDWTSHVQAPLRFDMGNGRYKVFDRPTAEALRNWSRSTMREAGGEHKGVLLALWLTPETARQLARKGGEPAESLHITLAYCDGDMADAVPVARRLAKAYPPLWGAVRGSGRFPASESSDGKDVLWAKPVVAGITPFRAKLATALEAAGVIPKKNFEWTPHITLAYVEPGTAKAPDTVPSVALRFSGLTVSQGDNRQDFPFRG